MSSEKKTELFDNRLLPQSLWPQMIGSKSI